MIFGLFEGLLARSRSDLLMRRREGQRSWGESGGGEAKSRREKEGGTEKMQVVKGGC